MKNKLVKILPITISLLVGGISIIIFPLILVSGVTISKNASSSSAKLPIVNGDQKPPIENEQSKPNELIKEIKLEVERINKLNIELINKEISKDELENINKNNLLSKLKDWSVKPNFNYEVMNFSKNNNKITFFIKVSKAMNSLNSNEFNLEYTLTEESTQKKEYTYDLFYLENNETVSGEFKTYYSFEEMIELLNSSNDKVNFGNKEILLSNFLYLKYINKNENFNIKNPLYSFEFKNEIITFIEPNKTLEELNNIKNSKNVFHINGNKSIYNSKHIKNNIIAYTTPLDFNTKIINQREKGFFENIELLKNKTVEEIVNGKLINQQFIFDNINLFVKGKHNITIDKISFLTIYIEHKNEKKVITFNFEIKENSIYHDGRLASWRNNAFYSIFWE